MNSCRPDASAAGWRSVAASSSSINESGFTRVFSTPAPAPAPAPALAPGLPPAPAPSLISQHNGQTETSPTSMPFSSRNDISAMERVSGGCGAIATVVGGARYSPHHHQLLQQFGSAAAHVRSSSSSAESVSSSSPPPALPPPLPLPYRRVRTLYACLGESEGELSFEPNQVITNVAASGEPGWLRGDLDGRHGLVPENYVEPLP